MPAQHSTASTKLERKAGSAGQLSKKAEPCQCTICGKKISRASDLKRHLDTHNTDAKRFPCPWEGCQFSARQKSNLETHNRTHTGNKSCVCKDDPDRCEFRACDPALLLRHRKSRHGYKPRAKPSTDGQSSMAPTHHPSTDSSSSGRS